MWKSRYFSGLGLFNLEGPLSKAFVGPFTRAGEEISNLFKNEINQKISIPAKLEIGSF